MIEQHLSGNDQIFGILVVAAAAQAVDRVRQRRALQSEIEQASASDRRFVAVTLTPETSSGERARKGSR